MDSIKKMYAGVNGYDPYKITVTYVENKWIGRVALVLAVVVIRFLCCA